MTTSSRRESVRFGDVTVVEDNEDARQRWPPPSVVIPVRSKPPQDEDATATTATTDTNTNANANANTHTNTPRMVITHLVLTNFKSYAGSQYVGPFHPSFSSVVGPNGSGKSNVIDSLLFVFGFRASKMRQGKVSGLVHHSAANPNIQYCEVEVHFQHVIDRPSSSNQAGNNEHEAVPGSQIVVSRRAFKNNTSKYYLNGKETNFSYVAEFLREKGIDLDHKRFLILQGEVESISQMKAKAPTEHDDGLLEYLEDIIGTSKYKTPIEEAAAELENLNDVCSEKNNRVQHVEKERDALEDKKNAALVYLRDENELAEKQAGLYQIYITECQNNLRVTEEAIREIKELLNQELSKHQGNEDGINEMRREYKRRSKECEALATRTQAMQKELAKHSREQVKFEEKKKFLEGKEKKLEKDMQTIRLSGSECHDLVQRHTDDMHKKTTEIAALEAEVKVQDDELARIRDSLKGKTQGVSDQIAEKQKSLEPWDRRINEVQSAMAVARSELDMLNEKRNSGSVALEELRAKIACFSESMEAKDQELQGRNAEKAQLEAEINKIERDLERASVKEPEARKRVASARQKADEARASLTSVQNSGSVLAGLMRLKESGRISGFHGRLGNLGTIDERFDVAISTACPALENLVVDSVEVGQACIDYLRKNQLGRANFILLDRLPRRDLAPIQTPENVPRLFDLIRPRDARFAPAFYSVLRDTIVAKDLTQANRIAYGARRWRVVTLEGQLIDVSGTMSGGGTRVARGGMSSKPVSDVTKEQVTRFETEREDVENKFTVFQEKQRAMETEIREKKDELPRVQTMIQKLVLDIESHQQNINDSRKRGKEIMAAHKPSAEDDAKAATLEQQIAAMEHEIHKLRDETADVNAEIASLQNTIMEIGGVKLRGQKARVDGLKSQIDLLNEEISNAEVAKSKNEKALAKHEKTYRDTEREIANIQQELQQFLEQGNNQDDFLANARRQTDEAIEFLETKKEELNALKEEVDAKTSELNDTRAKEIEMRNKLDENQKALVDNQKREGYWQDKLAGLSLHSLGDLAGGQQQQHNQDRRVSIADGGEEIEDDQESQVRRDEEAGGDANANASAEDEDEEMDAAPSLPMYTQDELADMDKDALKAAIAVLEEKTQRAQTGTDLSVIQEYRRRAAEFQARSADLRGAVASRDSVKTRLESLRSLRLSGFMEGFGAISQRLKEMYHLITMGGNAELELVDSLDPFAEGILFSVMPPKKSWKNISNLSGGEKTLSSLALVFALHHYRPTPLYVMDEIDAALDFKNVSIVAAYIKERTKNAQFIVISLRNNMFELASRLVGVYKVNHMTRSVTIENKDYISR